MALVAAHTIIPYPGWIGECVTGFPATATDQTLDAAGEYTAWVGQAQEDMTVSHVGFRAGTVAGSPTAEVRIETLSSGNPSGTLFGTNTNATTATISSDTWVLTALTASATITKGQFFAVLIKYASGTSIIVQKLNNLQNNSTTLPYDVTNVSGSAAKTRVVGIKGIALGSSTTSFYLLRGMAPVNAITVSTFNNTNSAKRGLRFQMPFPGRAVGLRWYNSNSTGDCNVGLYSDAGSELSSSSTALTGANSAQLNSAFQYAFFDNAVSLAKDTWYRAAVEPSSATNVVVATITLPSLNYRSAYPGGTNQHYTTFASGSWSDTATDQLPIMEVLLDQIDDGTGGGGSAAYVIGG